jgi:hypothetical protein
LLSFAKRLQRYTLLYKETKKPLNNYCFLGNKRRFPLHFAYFFVPLPMQHIIDDGKTDDEEQLIVKEE